MFDPSRDTWSTTGSLRVARAFAVVARLGDGDVLVAGGRTATGVTGESERYLAVAAPVFTSPSTVHLRSGVYATVTVTATGTPTPTLTEHGALPPGTAFRANANGTARIYGTPSPEASGTFTVSITATNGVGDPVAQILRITATPPTSPTGVGFWDTTSYGAVLFKGAARPIAPRTPQHPRDVVGMAATSDRGGYCLVSGHG